MSAPSPARSPRLRGHFVALPTPLRAGRLDLDAFARLVERQLPHAGLVVAGTTGEATSLEPAERRELIALAAELAAKQAAGRATARAPIVAGVGTARTSESIRLAEEARAAGADALLLSPPPYVRPSRRALAVHLGAVADATDAPVVLYDIPKRTGVALDLELVERLRDAHPGIVALKLATEDPVRMRAFVDARVLPILCGDDGLLLRALAGGAAGSINVVGNLAPELLHAIHAHFGHDRALDGLPRAIEEADRAEFERALAPLLSILALDVNPVAVKGALARLGLCEDEVRPPLLTLDDDARALLSQMLTPTDSDPPGLPC